MKLICSFTLILMAVFVGQAHAQTAILRGQVLDESGALVPGAKVTLTGSGGFVKTATASSEGSYNFPDLPAGNYTVQASAPNLTVPQPPKVALKTGTLTLHFRLIVSLP